MALTKHKLGELIEQTFETNSDGIYIASDVKGMTITKEIIPTKADVSNTNLSKFIVVKPSEFIFNPRTHGKKIGFGYNDTQKSFIISWNNIAFRVKKAMINVVVPQYLFLHFNRSEWDREACFHSWGSSTEVFTWDALCEMEINLPPVFVQKKFVAVYNALLENKKVYEHGLDDLKLVCDGYIENLRRNMPAQKLGNYIERHDKRNFDNKIKNVMGISTSKNFREPTSKVNRNELSSYKIVAPRQITFVQTTHNEKVFAYAFNDTDEDIVVSSVNEVFSTDETQLLPEYLLMFFNRSEFDRYARFHSWGSAREVFTWKDLCEVKIPIPEIKIQRSIAAIYEVLRTRKKILERLKTQIKDICPILIKGSLDEGATM